MGNRRSFIQKIIPLGILPFTPITNLQIEKPTMNKMTPKPRVIFFDVNETLLDLEPLKASIVEKLDNKAELGTLWFTTMLQYSLVVTVANQYYDFGAIGAAALQMIAKNNNIKLSSEQAKDAVKPILSLQPHPEVVEALTLLKKNNYKLVTFTNSSNYAIAEQMKNSGLAHFFEENISVEDFGKFKPDEGVYHWAARKMKVDNKDCMLIAAHGWDVAGASWAGWQSAFLARKGQQLFPLAPQPNYNTSDLLTLAKILIAL